MQSVASTLNRMTVVQMVAIACSCALAAGTTQGADPTPLAAAMKAEIAVTIEAQPLTKAVADLLNRQQIPWCVDSAAQKTLREARTDRIELPHRIQVQTALTLLLERHNLSTMDCGALVMIVTAERARHVIRRQTYCVASLIDAGLPMAWIAANLRLCSPFPEASFIQRRDAHTIMVQNEAANLDLIADELDNMRRHFIPERIEAGELDSDSPPAF